MDDDRLSQLMTAYQRGDLGAFEELYTALRSRLLRYLVVLVRSRSRADDLLQETFLQVHRSRRTYTPPRPVVPWMFAIARHVYLMDVRRRSRYEKQEVAADDDALPEIPVPPEAETWVDQDRLQTALRSLPGDDVEVLTLHYVWGFTFTEIGGMLGIRAGTAKVRAFRGMKRLKDAFAADRNQPATLRNIPYRAKS